MDKDPSKSATTLQIGDIYYVLIRHAWKIVLCVIAGLIAAYVYRRQNAPPYSSTAKLYIRYVTESQGIKSTGEEELQTRTPGQRGDTTLATETAILTSLNVAKQAAASVGPAKILGAYGGGDDLDQAAGLISSALVVDVPRFGAVVNITFTHRDQAVVEPILNEIITQYLKRHLEMHRGGGLVDSFLAQQTDQMRSQLAQTEEELRKARANAGVISSEESRNYYASTISRLRQEYFNTQAAQAQHIAILSQLTKDQPTKDQPTKDQPTIRNPSEGNSSPNIKPEVAQAYQDLAVRIETLRKREQELLLQLTPESSQIKDLRAMLSNAYSEKAELESANPQLSVHSLQVLPVPDDRSPSLQSRINDVSSLLAVDEATMKMVVQQLAQTQAEAAKLDQNEVAIEELQRRRAIEEKNYIEYSTNLAKARSAEALGVDQISNISQIQTPTPPFRDWTKVNKICLGIAGGGVVLGLGWAFLVGYVLDRSIRRPSDVEQVLKLPLFLSIPRQAKKILRQARANLESRTENSDHPGSTGALALYEGGNALDPYFETLRDRLIAYFESINLRHSPKLIAVTGLGSGSGVSTTAAGLARSLSETGAGNVLLVDMTQNAGQRTALPYAQGKVVANIDNILASQVADKGDNKFFIVSEGTGIEKLSRQLPHRFNQLFPKLKASNFDYIIFDMPPVSQISITPRLAASMDTVLMVIESEKTDREMAQRAVSLLSKANANVGVILNKTNASIPENLLKSRDLLLDS